MEEERTSDVEDKSMKIIQFDEKSKTDGRKNRVSETYGTHLGILICNRSLRRTENGPENV